MKQIVQSYKTGEIKLREVPVPRCGSKRILVRNRFSLVSIGTERSTIDLGRKSMVGKAVARPDLVRKVWDKAKKEGLIKTWQEAMGRLDTPTPMGYSSAGVIEECGLSVTEFSPRDRVACMGQGFASHAEFVSVPANLTSRIPEKVSDEQASFGMLGVIALHGIRCAGLLFGSRVVVMGLGLLGLLTIQILRAYGCQVLAIDPAEDKVDLAKKMGFIDVVSDPSRLQEMVNTKTQAFGADAVLITATTKKHDPVDQAIKLCRPKARIVVVGVVDIHPDRNEMWEKEVELLVSKAAGPGSLDPLYEIEGVDLPIGEVRWTQKRNLEEFLRLLENGKVDINPLISHRFPISEAEKAYTLLMQGKINAPIGVLLEYPRNTPIERQLKLPYQAKTVLKDKGSVNTGVIGAGLFGKAILLPTLKNEAEINLHTLVTSSSANVEHNARKFGFAKQATDESEVWDSEHIKAVVGLTPHHHHASLVKSSLKSGKALLIEKPICVSEEELEEIKQLALEVDKLPVILVGQNRRFSPHVRKLQAWLKQRKPPFVAHIRVNAGFIPVGHWVHSEDEGRSRVVGEMTHFIDLLQALSGSLVNRVHAERIGGDNRSSVNNDNIVVSLKFKEGSVANLTYSASGDKAYSREFVEVFFDGQTLVCKDFRISEKHNGGRTDIYKTSGQKMGYREEVNHFIKCVKGSEKPMVSLEEAFSTMNTVFAIERSLAKGKAITV